MVTADQQKLATRKLSHWIENEKKVVTYRDISRHVGCHVNIAKNILLDHLNSHPELAATYLLTGPLLRESTISQTVIHDGPASPSKGSQSLLHLGGTQKVRIRDMDEMSEGDRNSEDEEDDTALDLDESVGNDKGALEEVALGPGAKLQGDGAGLGTGIGGWSGAGRGAERADEVVQPEQVSRWGVVLVGQAGLEEKKKLFERDTLSIHIYALAPSPVNDPAQYLVSTLSLRDHPKYHDATTYGTFTGHGIGAASGSSTGATGDKPAMRDGTMDWGKKKVEVTKAEIKVEATAKKGEAVKVAPPLAVATAPAGAASSSLNKTAKATKSTKASQSQSQAQSQSLSKKKRVVQSDTESDGEGDNEASAATATKPTASPAVQPTSSLVRAEDKAAMEAMMSMDMDADLSAGEGEEEDKKPDLAKLEKRPSTKSGKASGGRKRRKVKKSVQEIDAKGYMVTKDHWSDESYSGDSEPEPDTKPTPAQTKSQKSSSSSKPPLKGRESTASLGSGKEDKKPASSSFGGGSGSAGGKGGKMGGKPATGQSTLKGFFTKK